MYDKHICFNAELLKILEYVWLNFTVIENRKCNIQRNAHYDPIEIFLLIIFYYHSPSKKNIIISYFSNSALESFRLKFKVNSKDNEPLCNVLCKYKECIRTYYMYTSDCSNRDGFARNTSSSYHTCKHHQSTLNQMNIYLIYY